MGKSKLETAKYLAKVHFEVEPNLQRVHLLEPFRSDDPRDPIRLLEVVEGTLEGDILPVGFASDPERGIDYPFSIIEMSPREYKDLSGKPLHVDQHVWTIGEQLIAR